MSEDERHFAGLFKSIDERRAELESAVVSAAIEYRQSVLRDVAPDAPAPKSLLDAIANPHATFDDRVNEFCRQVDVLIKARETEK